MKKFIEQLQTLQSRLLAKIQKNEIPIASANGVPLAEEGLSYDYAKDLIKGAKAFTKESRQFAGDTTKKVISKALLKKILYKRPDSNLFFLEHLHESITHLLIRKDELRARERSSRKKNEIRPDMHIWLLVLWIVIAIAAFTVVVIGRRYYSFSGVTITYFSAIGVAAILGLLWQLNKNKKAKEDAESKGEEPAPTPMHSFLYGHDVKKDTSPDQGYESVKTKFSFSEVQNYAELVSFALKQNGRVGYLFTKDTPYGYNYEPKYRVFDSSNGEGSEYLCTEGFIRYTGQVLPVVVLKESVIFFEEYMSIIPDERLFSGNKGIMDMFIKESNLELLV